MPCKTPTPAYLVENGLAAGCSAVEGLVVVAAAAVAAAVAVVAVAVLVVVVVVVAAAVVDLAINVAVSLVDMVALSLATAQLEVRMAGKPSAPGIDAMVEPSRFLPLW